MDELVMAVREIARAMRDAGAVEVTFAVGPVRTLRLGAAPQAALEVAEPAPPVDPEEAERRALADYERTLFASAGG